MYSKEEIKLKILRIMSDGKLHSITEISEKTMATWVTIRNHFLELQLDNKIVVERIGKKKFFKKSDTK